jgi:phage/plasmid-associated DNA primase
LALTKFEDNNIKFDENPHLLGFLNGVYELNNDVFRQGKADDYISRVVPYEWRESTADELNKVDEHFAKVFPIEDERALFWQIMASCIHGQLLERFIIFTGKGANSKDSIMTNLIPAVLGEHYYRANNSCLTQQQNGDMNAAIANMHKKRIVVYSEPNANTTLKTSLIKEMTGSKMLNFRAPYQGDGSKTMMCATHIMLCNDKPLLDVVDDAIQRRLIILPFRATFKNKDEIKNYEDMDYIFEGSNTVKSEEFINEIRLHVMNNLIKSYKTFRRNGYDILNIPKQIQEEAKTYINDSCEFATWFLNNYEFVEDRMQIVKADDVYKAYRVSDLYNNLSKRDKRRITKKAIITKIEEHPTLKLYYRRRVRFAGLDRESVFIKCIEKERNDEDE